MFERIGSFEFPSIYFHSLSLFLFLPRYLKHETKKKTNIRK